MKLLILILLASCAQEPLRTRMTTTTRVTTSPPITVIKYIEVAPEIDWELEEEMEQFEQDYYRKSSPSPVDNEPFEGFDTPASETLEDFVGMIDLGITTVGI